MSISRHANWLDFDGNKLFFWHHIPANNDNKTVAIIVGPVGPEYMHCFRSIKLLSDSIAEAGFHTIRYDPIGMGNSSGSLEDENIWSKWRDTPKALFQHLKEQHNVDNAVLIGLRSGCLIVSECLHDFPVEAAVFWYPYTRGAAYIRDIELLDSMLYENSKIKKGQTLNGGGYPVTQQLKESISKVNLFNQDYTSLTNSLLIMSKEITSKSRLQGILVKQGVTNTTKYLEGLDAMTKQVAISKIPYSNIECIKEWLNSLRGTSRPTSRDVIYNPSKNINPDYIESIVNINAVRPLFGILTTPTEAGVEQIVLIVNTGAAHHVGPNRFHVDAARSLAAKGISTLRIDISNLGDSSNNHEQDSNHPYPSTATEDIETALNFINTKYNSTRITLCGLCSGAHNVFHAALNTSNSNIHNIIIINPITFYWKPGQSIFAPEDQKINIDESYYRKQMFDIKKWLTLITNPKKMYNTSVFLFTFLANKLKKIYTGIFGSTKSNNKSQLEKDITLLANKNIAIGLIYSRGDPGHSILMSQAAKTIEAHRSKGLYKSIEIINADHTFSSIDSRLELCDAIVKLCRLKDKTGYNG